MIYLLLCRWLYVELCRSERNNQRARGQTTAEPQSLSEIRPTPEGETELV